MIKLTTALVALLVSHSLVFSAGGCVITNYGVYGSCSNSSDATSDITQLGTDVAGDITGTLLTKYTEIKGVTAQIKQQAKNKQKHTKNIANLSKANALKEKKLAFEYEKYKKLLAVYIDMEATAATLKGTKQE
ncbi:hypothetical protein [Helicobacter sp. T3_23-1059]